MTFSLSLSLSLVSNSFGFPKQDPVVAESFASASEVEGKENLPISRNQFDFTPSAYESYR